jgi:hypothetical protein
MPITSRVIEELAYQGFSRRDHSHGSVLLGARSQTDRKQNWKAGLFWFTISSLLNELTQNADGEHTIPEYLASPKVIFGPIWPCPTACIASKIPKTRNRSGP